MQTLKLEAPWEDVKKILQEAEHSLTEEDLAYTPGQDSELIQRLAKKMDRSEEDIKGWIESASHTTHRAS